VLVTSNLAFSGWEQIFTSRPVNHIPAGPASLRPIQKASRGGSGRGRLCRQASLLPAVRQQFGEAVRGVSR